MNRTWLTAPHTTTRCAALLALLGGLLHGSAAAAGDYLGLQRYTLREGLPQMTVASLEAAPDGHLWVGTQEGLSRFDGQVFDVFRHQPGEPGSLASSSVDALAIDAAERLWIGTNDRGVEVRGLRSPLLIRIGTEQGLSHPTASALLVFGDGVIAGTPRGFDRLQLNPPTAAIIQRGAEAVALAAHAGKPFGLDRDCGLWQLDPLPARALPSPFPAGAQCVAMRASDAGLWVASSGHGLALVSNVGARLRHWDPAQLGSADAQPSALGVLRSGALLLGFDSGALARLDEPADARATPLQLSTPAGSRITGFLEHASGTLWIGTYSSGLLRAGTLSPALHAGLQPRADAAQWPSRSVHAVWQDATQGLLGTERGLLRREGLDGPWQPVPAIGARSVRRILAHPQGGWWIGSMDGLWRLWPDGQAERQAASIDPRTSDLVYQGERLWISTRDGLYFMDGDAEPSQVGVPEALRRGFLTALLLDEQGHLWIGSNERGLHVLTADGGMHWLHRGNGRLVIDSVWSLHPSAEGVYVGTYGGGLQRVALQSSEVWHLGTRDGMSNNVVYRIESDDRGRLWLSTNRGLNLVDPATRSVQVISASDGLANTEYNAGASFRDAEGRLYFGGTEGLDVIDPGSVPDSAAAASPRLSRLESVGGGSGLRAGGDPDWQAIVIDPPLRFAWNERVLSATLVAIDLSAPDAARLRYRLLGLDDRWITPRSARSEVLISGLAAGAYELELQAAGRDGRFGESARISLEIKPPAWATPLAKAGYIALGLVLLGSLIRRQQQRSRAKQARIAELNQLVEQRTADLQAANQQLVRSNAQLDRAGRTDPLTQVSNRRDLHEWLALQGSHPGPRGLLFCLLDIDDFKSINDLRGHRAGDRVLVAFAARLRELCREGDLVVRWGGEEFLLVLQGIRGADLDALLDRLLEQTAKPIALDEGEPVTVHCSIGVAGFPFVPGRDDPDWEQVVALADRALYRAKSEGKRGWQLWSAGPRLDDRGLAALLAGAPPEQLAAGAVEVRRGSVAGRSMPPE